MWWAGRPFDVLDTDLCGVIEGLLRNVRLSDLLLAGCDAPAFGMDLFAATGVHEAAYDIRLSMDAAGLKDVRFFFCSR